MRWCCQSLRWNWIFLGPAYFIPGVRSNLWFAKKWVISSIHKSIRQLLFKPATAWRMVGEGLNAALIILEVTSSQGTKSKYDLVSTSTDLRNPSPMAMTYPAKALAESIHPGRGCSRQAAIMLGLTMVSGTLPLFSKRRCSAIDLVKV